MAKSKKYILFSLLVVLGIALMIALTSCIENRIDNKKSDTIIDSYRREVKVPTDVQRIATVGSATRLVVYVGAVDKLVAITEMDRPSELRPYTIAYEKEFKDIPKTNNGNHLNSTTVDEEKMLEINPDVILSTRSADECDELQDHLKIPVVGINASGDYLDEQYKSSLQLVGQITGMSEKANELIGYMHALCNVLSNPTKPVSPKLYRGAINYKGSKDLTGTFSQYNIYKIINATNVADNPNIEGAYDTSLEQILAWNPDFIFIDYSNKDKVANQIKQNPEVFNQLQAYRNKQIYCCAPYNNNGANIEYALCECYMTAKLIYPEVYSEINLEQKFAEIINRHLGKDIYQELVARGVYFGPAQL